LWNEDIEADNEEVEKTDLESDESVVNNKENANGEENEETEEATVDPSHNYNAEDYVNDGHIQVELTAARTGNRNVEKAEEFPRKQGGEDSVNGAEKEAEVSHTHVPMELDEKETNKATKEKEEFVEIHRVLSGNK